MLGNNLKMAVRMIKRYKVYSLMNFLGLSIGMTCFILILLYVRYELSYDKYHENADRIYRIAREVTIKDEIYNVATTSSPVAPTLTRECPQIEKAVRILPFRGIVESGNKKFQEERFYFGDSTFFEVFTFPLILGHPREALKFPNSVVLTKEAANKYFGNENPMGKIMTFENKYDFVVTGVFRDIAHASHFHFEFVASMSRNAAGATGTAEF